MKSFIFRSTYADNKKSNVFSLFFLGFFLITRIIMFYYFLKIRLIIPLRIYYSHVRTAYFSDTESRFSLIRTGFAIGFPVDISYIEQLTLVPTPVDLSATRDNCAIPKLHKQQIMQQSAQVHSRVLPNF